MHYHATILRHFHVQSRKNNSTCGSQLGGNMITIKKFILNFCLYPFPWAFQIKMIFQKLIASMMHFKLLINMAYFFGIHYLFQPWGGYSLCIFKYPLYFKGIIFPFDCKWDECQYLPFIHKYDDFGNWKYRIIYKYKISLTTFQMCFHKSFQKFLWT
jgi:hypothetical protein